MYYIVHYAVVFHNQGLYYNLILQALELPPRMSGADMNTCKHWELQKHTNTYSKATSNSVEKRKLL